MLSLLFISYLSNKVVCTKCWMSIFYCSEEASTSTQRQWHRQRVWLGELQTVLHLSLLIIGPTVALMLAHRWPTGGPTGMPHGTVGPTLAHWPKWRWPTGGCQRWPNGGATGGPTLGHRWPNSGVPLLGQRWPTGQNDVGPPVAANGGPTAGPPVAQRWATGGPTVACHCWANVGPPAKMTLAHWWLPTVAQRRSHRWPNVGPPESCYLGNVLLFFCLIWSNMFVFTVTYFTLISNICYTILIHYTEQY